MCRRKFPHNNNKIRLKSVRKQSTLCVASSWFFHSLALFFFFLSKHFFWVSEKILFRRLSDNIQQPIYDEKDFPSSRSTTFRCLSVRCFAERIVDPPSERKIIDFRSVRWWRFSVHRRISLFCIKNSNRIRNTTENILHIMRWERECRLIRGWTNFTLVFFLLLFLRNAIHKNAN